MGLRSQWFRWVLVGLTAAVVLLGSGCTTTEADNQSSRPWAAPRSWETGLPAGILEGR